MVEFPCVHAELVEERYHCVHAEFTEERHPYVRAEFMGESEEDILNNKYYFEPWVSINWTDDIKEEGDQSTSTSSTDEWIISVLEVRPIQPSQNQQMQKVPQELREMEKMNKGRLFNPRVVSIGPYYHGEAELEEAERLKARAASEFVGGSTPKASEFYNEILKKVEDARNCYLPNTTDSYTDEEFARMMFLDGCFLLQLMAVMVPNRMHKQPQPQPPPPPPPSSRSFLKELICHIGFTRYLLLYTDLILLENQLPFLVLHTLLSKKYQDQEDEDGRWKKLIENYIDMIYTHTMKTSEKKYWRLRQNYKLIAGDFDQPLHFLELVRRRFVGENHPPPRSSSCHCSFFACTHSWCKTFDKINEFSWSASAPSEYDAVRTLEEIFRYSFRSATELKAKGIYFRASTSFCLTDLNFASRYGYGRLTLPQVSVSRQTTSLFVNMMAYELSAPEVNQLEVCNYIYFMNSLINGAEDVMELRSHNIIHNFLGTDDEVAKLFNTMAAFGSTPSFKGTIKDVNDRIQRHYSSLMYTWMAQLLHNYFSTPWAVVAFVAAIFGLTLTFIQTFYPRSGHN